MRCASCGSEAPSDARFCAQCGAFLIATSDPDHRVEPVTDAVPGPPVAAAPADPDGDGDRRVVTALFADLVDYVRMLAEHDPEVVRARVTAALSAMADAITRFGGTREKFIGDAVFAVFGWPQSHDDDAVRAALAALAIRSALGATDDGTEALEVRIGLATGEVVAAARHPVPDGDLRLTGEAITTAARIQSLARPGEILMDGPTRQAARDRLDVEPSGRVVLRGQSTPVDLFALHGDAGMGPWAHRRTTVTGPLVGREAELGELRTVLEGTLADGHGAVVVVVGEAGVGKSRLLAALEADARAHGFEWTWTENVSYGRDEPYRYARLFAQAIADEHGVDSGSFARQLLFADGTDPDTVRRFGGAIAAIARDAAFSGWEAEAPDTPADPADVAATLTDVAAAYLERLLTATGPRVVVIDDVHWLDPSSAGMVELIVDATVRHPVVVLAGARPGGDPLWSGRAHVRALELGGLTEPETARLATLVARAAVDAEGARSIHLRTGGNPLFVGETVRALLEDGTLQRRDGRVALVDPTDLRVPLTLRAVLGARIDALDADSRDAIDVASVVGIHFGEGDLAALLPAPIAPAVLQRLTDAALIEHVDGPDWRFAHALIHDAAYAGLLASRRRSLHGRFADVLEARGGATIEQIASHRAAAGDLARAIPLFREAAGTAMTMGAPMEAADFWRRAADLARHEDPAAAELDLRAAAEASQAAGMARSGSGGERG